MRNIVRYKSLLRQFILTVTFLLGMQAWGEEPPVAPSPTPEVIEPAVPSVPRAVHLQVSGDLGLAVLGGELVGTYLVSPIGLNAGLSLGASFLGDRLEVGAYYQYGVTTDFFTHLALVNAYGGYLGVRPFARILHISLRAGAHLSEGLGGFIIPLYYRGGAWGWTAGPKIALEFPVIEKEDFGFYMGPEFGLTYYSRTTALPSYFTGNFTFAVRLRF